MKELKNHSQPNPPNEETDSKKLHLTVNDCAVTLNFQLKAKDSSVISEIKRILVSGVSHPKV